MDLELFDYGFWFIYHKLDFKDCTLFVTGELAKQ